MLVLAGICLTEVYPIILLGNAGQSCSSTVCTTSSWLQNCQTLYVKLKLTSPLLLFRSVDLLMVQCFKWTEAHLIRWQGRLERGNQSFSQPLGASNRPLPSSLVPLFQNESKYETFHMKMSFACSFIFTQIKVVCIRIVSHLHSLWNRGTGELGNGPFLLVKLWRHCTLFQKWPPF